MLLESKNYQMSLFNFVRDFDSLVHTINRTIKLVIEQLKLSKDEINNYLFGRE